MSIYWFCQLDELKHIYEGLPDFLEQVFYLICVKEGKWEVHCIRIDASQLIWTEWIYT